MFKRIFKVLKSVILFGTARRTPDARTLHTGVGRWMPQLRNFSDARESVAEDALMQLPTRDTKLAAHLLTYSDGFSPRFARLGADRGFVLSSTTCIGFSAGDGRRATWGGNDVRTTWGTGALRRAVMRI